MTATAAEHEHRSIISLHRNTYGNQGWKPRSHDVTEPQWINARIIVNPELWSWKQAFRIPVAGAKSIKRRRCRRNLSKRFYSDRTPIETDFNRTSSLADLRCWSTYLCHCASSMMDDLLSDCTHCNAPSCMRVSSNARCRAVWMALADLLNSHSRQKLRVSIRIDRSSCASIISLFICPNYSKHIDKSLACLYNGI